MTGPISQALAAFRAAPQVSGWLGLPFFQDGSADRVAAKVDAIVASGAQVLPPPEAVFTSISLTPLDKVKVVVWARTPIRRRAIPTASPSPIAAPAGCRASLRTILAEMAQDLDVPMPKSGDLSKCARQGVLLINTALPSSRALGRAYEIRLVGPGRPGHRRDLGAAACRRLPALGRPGPQAGGARRPDEASRDRGGPPLPLNRLNDFRGTKPFSRANAWLAGKGLEP